ncbi:Crp/Fnr family transcriptional regulator [Nostoc sp. FACHB-87]|nr:Crp/Fnr family transcriptional regulator [Nostoc sp. FACHB-87]MBD2474755.1 Crp/Fnr family transcriptional regulator [Anabaena sp. FACHB-83]
MINFLNIDQLPDSIRIKMAITYENLTAGQILFHQGDLTTAIFVVISGQIRLMHYTSAGQSIKHYEVRTGESFAEAALFSEFYDCTAIADAPSRIATFPKPAFLATLRQYPDLSEVLVAQLARRFHQVKVLLELRSIRSARERVLHYLEIAIHPHGNTVNLEKPLKEIAEDMGLSQEAFSRVLSQLQKDGVITRKKRQITLHQKLLPTNSKNYTQ